MPAKLTTTINKISSVPSPMNSAMIQEFSEYMKGNGSSEHHQNNNLKAVIAFANLLGSHTTFYDIQKMEQIAAFLDTKINREDNENKWITTWNNYLTRLRLFFRWLILMTIALQKQNHEIIRQNRIFLKSKLYLQ
jgi:integrase/recombinase XerD